MCIYFYMYNWVFLYTAHDCAGSALYFVWRGVHLSVKTMSNEVDKLSGYLGQY